MRKKMMLPPTLRDSDKGVDGVRNTDLGPFVKGI